MSSRAEILALLGGEQLPRRPLFAGLPALTTPGLAAANLTYAETHHDPDRMARAAASTVALGFESAVVPFDMCVEAEALGCAIDFQNGEEPGIYLAPTVVGPLSLDLDPEQFLTLPLGIARLPVVGAALAQLRATLGATTAIGAWLPGPFTLAWQIFGADPWLTLTQKNPDRATTLLAALVHFLARVGQFYRASGADYLTLHEMGGSPQVIGPKKFRALVQPALTQLLIALPTPRVLSICGSANPSLADLATLPAEAFNFDDRTDLVLARTTLGPRALIFGNLDPVGLLTRGSPETITAAVNQIAPQINALWPGCDLYPDIPPENLRALIAAAHSL